MAARLSRIRCALSGIVSHQNCMQPIATIRPLSTSPIHHSNSTNSSPASPTTAPSSIIKDWKLGRLNHVAIAVPNLEKAAALYRDVLGAEVSKIVPLKEHGVYTVFVNLGNTKIELLHPLGEKSPIESFLAKRPDGGLHHICIEVDDIRKAIKDLDGKIRPLNPEPKIGAHGKPVVFLHPKDCDGVLVELEET